MKILISGQHMRVGNSLKTYIEEHVEKHVKKYFEQAVNTNITLVKEKSHIIKTEILVNKGTGTGVIIKSNGEDSDAYRSFEMALHKAEAQLRKYKSRLKNHHKDKEARNAALLEARQYVISPFGNEKDEHAEGYPTIIAEKMTSIETLSVSDAVMQMDLHDLPTLVFINSSNNRLNVVYYRNDGNISWVDLPTSK